MSTRPLKRALPLTAAFLLLGAALNLAIAWACALWSPAKDVTGAVQLYQSGDPSMKLARTWAAPLGAGTPNVTGLALLYEGFGVRVCDVHERYPRDTTYLDGKNVDVLVLQSGWPWTALCCDAETSAAVGPTGPQWRGGCNLPAWVRPVDMPGKQGLTSPRPFPVRPAWPGLVAGAALYAAMAASALGAAAGIRRLRRMSRGRCPSCGYSLAGLSAGACPECGKPFSSPMHGAMRFPVGYVVRSAALCLLLGGAFSVVLAWACALWAPPPAVHRDRIGMTPGSMKGLIPPKWSSHTDTSLERCFVTKMPGLTVYWMSMFATADSFELAGRLYPPVSRSVASAEFRLLRAGWPAACLECHTILPDPGSGSPPAWSGGVLPAASLRPRDHSIQAPNSPFWTPLPLRPVWTGLALNSLLYGGLCAAALLGARARRAHLRRRREVRAPHRSATAAAVSSPPHSPIFSVFSVPLW